ncbi:hypothetical protein K402DRAFT_387626 [Aulographum hederae CBS 113979]|uniref:Ribosomal RNA methyltransferase FtsJ domain-containing protein n=1 Tax=Aulographum hederae CBS 113979 TaxID=1176131 RepID=A0A6G1GIZ9_9PEZI|nr:hypothetical protein K402DRAFT_387626 [Aulographum hederae CBS 113979]
MKESSDDGRQESSKDPAQKEVDLLQYPRGEEGKRVSSVITQYLQDNAPEFRRLTELRQQGWSNSEGDRFFQMQRHNADTADEKMARIFYKMMKEIAQEMQRATGALAISDTSADAPAILDLCMAPGGFLATALKLNPTAQALAFSLPPSEGGHNVFLPNASNVTLKFLDVTLLAADMCVTVSPDQHPEAKDLLPRQIDSGQLFDLVLCDGQVLRTQTRVADREYRQARRLTVTQLAIGLERVRTGGTMVVLLHKVEAPDTVFLLYTFSKFCSVRLFKPRRHHAKRSSFYMIASDVRNRDGEAVRAMERWKRMWEVATFGTDEEYENVLHEDCFNAEEVLGKFGSELLELGREVWETQAKALEKAPFIKR